ncbi:phosphatidylserine/phosphatidylglycerophosphate/cardiolipin synthase family protein [Diaphorobacter sp. JS3051]|uniref:phospholipase D-like domain-containing protein n=1 Tax=Diaphorobacter sp. JS3051 TaxID=2792224 RepID=UPI0018CA7EFA|nr:phospholipase D family protein [Diaphorobacter sp. JS3051]
MSFIDLLRHLRHRTWSRWPIMALLVLSFGGCGGLPKDVDRPVSMALDTAGEPTELATIVQQLRQKAGARHASGFSLLSGPQEAYGSRLALVQSAQKTLDLQYYAIHADASSAHLLRSVVNAARRGVRVRILLDDFHSTGRNALVMRMAFEPNIEMRMFNPVAGPRASFLGRMWGAVSDFSRVQQRMHNKLFLADNMMGVTGGRNLGDAYFGKAEAENFVDLDVLAVGPIVADMSRSFDSYWNNPRAYPVQSLVSREELDRLRAQVRSSGEKAGAQAGSPGSTTPADRPSASSPQWDTQPMDLRTVDFIWAPAAMLVDEPTKIPLEGDEPPPSAAIRAGTTPGAHPEASDTPQAPPAPAAPVSSGDTVVDGLLTLMDRTRRELLIISPYFVPGDDMKRAFARARQRGVRVRLLTNSLASNDAPIAHVGYARHRKDLLAMGVELYELRSEQAGLRSAFGSSGASAAGASRSMLHSKVMVVDGRMVVVGSMNLDLRSQLHNTEIALLIRSRALAAEAAQQIDTAMREGAWHLQRSADGDLVWRAPQGSGLEDAHTDPDSSLALRLLLKLLGPLAPDHLL